MNDNLTAEQAAQRLLTLLDTLGVQNTSSNNTGKAKTGKRQPNASSISWAFHESADKTGLLRWLADNITAAKNGLTDDELELMEYLERTNYHNSDPNQQPQQHRLLLNEPVRTGNSQFSTDSIAQSGAPAFEMRMRKDKVQKNVARLEKHAEILRGQNAVLTSRADSMAHELAELRAEEEALTRAATSTDSELARLLTMHLGQLDEASLAAKALMAQLKVDAPKNSKGHTRFHYQSLEAIDQLGAAMQGIFKVVGEQVALHLRRTNELPSPWKEFRPFAANSVPELLHLATAEHARVGASALDLAKAKLKLKVECELVRAIGEEVGRAQSQNNRSNLLHRCQQLTASETSGFDIDRIINERAQELAQNAQADTFSTAVPADHRRALDLLNESHNALAQSQSDQLSRKLESIAQSLDSQHHSVEHILGTLVNERDMLDGWSELWSTVSASIDRDNADNEKQKTDLERVGAVEPSGRQVIHPDDHLALSLKRLLSMSSRANQAVLMLSQSTAGLASAKKIASVSELLRPMLTSSADSSGCGLNVDVGDDGDVEMRQNQLRVQNQESWLSDGAVFTSWDALLADAKTSLVLGRNARDVIGTEVKTAEALERKMDCSLANMVAALHGGECYSGTEAVDILPTEQRNILGELKLQAGTQRKRVTKATMLAEEPGKAAASNYAALFCQFY
ncbi:hypothetical protein BX661DRAFT_187616 [Kickxella alabastrina]|uniref:uncharacterized protein n=1 Tax=Kickxella alabastrina TaxID=61397 RepID=UPI00221EA48B|nr:uncharacterized protein BX661DRAFT_187616 [Kickxella alabastrina]KAI7822278.1 hypothetical protein BX661DRAFT_187616 [Kickxella alabastrina]KAJ1947354.1 hypothetical protein GGF37_000536 [Kickxella alabastrina]